MMSDLWLNAAMDLHARVETATWDSLTRSLLSLHRPYVRDASLLICKGCDHEPPASAAMWPCRSYTLIAQTVLHVDDIEGLLQALMNYAASVTERVNTIDS